jgi:hypothetical protein
MEGKETRFGITNSALWAVVTTAASNGSVNSMHDSFTPIGGMIPMFLMKTGEVIFGGVGAGLYGMFVFIVLAVFIAAFTPIPYKVFTVAAGVAKLNLFGFTAASIVGAQAGAAAAIRGSRASSASRMRRSHRNA